MAFCKECGTALDEDANFCMECGTPASDSTGKGRASAGIIMQPVYHMVNLEDLPEGHVVDDRYEIREKIGQGGFGAVYKVYDRKMEIDKALKVLTQAVVNDREAMDTLKKEATTMARLNHPNIVRLYDFKETGPIKYLDMEYVDGMNLREAKRAYSRKKLSEKQARALGRKIARGLLYAHNEKVIHRDIKPQNILISRKTGVKIMDFGVSETVRCSMSRVANSVASGTLVYMSPEQLKGKDVGREADIYSFGALLYDLVSGKPPFCKGDVAYQVLNEKPEPVPHVSDEFNAFLQKCLAKDYADRYRSFDEVYDLLKKEDESSSRVSAPVSVKPPPEQPVAEKEAQVESPLPLTQTVVQIEPEVMVHLSDRHVQPGLLRKHGGSILLAIAIAFCVVGGVGILDVDNPSVQAYSEPEIRLTNGVGMEFVYIEPGSFVMGSPSSEPGRYSNEIPHRVTLTKGYYLQTTEVTQGQWRHVMGDNPSHFSECGDDCPVERVSWHDAQDFIGKLNQIEGHGMLRLPTEAEWEYASRAGSGTPYADGNTLDEMGWYRDNSEGQTHRVGQKKANAWGLHDMHGNVWEWCADWKGGYSSNPVADPKGPASGTDRILRGGGWLSGAKFCRSAVHSGGAPDSRLTNLGFRIAYSLE